MRIHCRNCEIQKRKNIHSICNTDHIHLLLLLPPDISLSSFMQTIKSYSSKWLKSRAEIDSNFSWQKGYVGVSTQQDKIDQINTYFRTDEIRHSSRSYREELRSILDQQKIDYQEKYLLQGSYSKILLHAVWSTCKREHPIYKNTQAQLYNEINDVLTNRKGILYEIGGVDDHIHLLFEMPRDIALADLMREIKTSATHWLKQNDRERYSDFEWQDGYGAFSISYSCFENVKNYIQRQEEHHSEKSFKDEWMELLCK